MRFAQSGSPQNSSQRSAHWFARTVSVAGCLIVAACSSGGGKAVPTASSGPLSGLTVDSQFIEENLPNVSPELIKAACAEGRLSIYQIAVTPTIDSIDELFRKTFGCIELQDIRAASGELETRFAAAVRSGSVPDILEGTDIGKLQIHADEGHFQKYTPAGASAAGATSDQWYPQFEAIMGVLIAKDSIPSETIDEQASWNDVLTHLKGVKVSYVSPGAGGTSLAFYDFVSHGLPSGKESFKSFREANPGLTQSTSRPAAQAVASGQAEAALPMALATAVELIDSGAPLQFVVPTPVVAVKAGFGIAAQAQHPNAAKLWAEFALSKPVQALWPAKNAHRAARTDVPFSNPVTRQPWWHLPTEAFSVDYPSMAARAKETIAWYDGLGK